MSTLESFIWHFLGYTAMPVIILTGFAAVAAFSVWLLSLGKDKEIDQKQTSQLLPIMLTLKSHCFQWLFYYCTI